MESAKPLWVISAPTRSPILLVQLNGLVVPAHVKLDLIVLIVFDGVNVALHVLYSAADRFPCRPWLTVVG